MGAAIAYHLTERGCTNVVLLERKSLAAEGTGNTGGIVRQHYSQDVIIKAAVRSVRFFEEFEERTGRGDAFMQTGWIKLGSEEMRPAMERNVPRHRELGVESRMLSMEELREAIPGINTDGVGAAVIEPRSGHADPFAVTHGLTDVAKDRGVEIREGVTATGIQVTGGSVTAVETDAGTIATSTVVNAAGPWGARVASWVGVDVPIEITREQHACLACDDQRLMPRLPVSDNLDRIYWRREKPDLLLVGDGYPKESEYVDPDSFNAHEDAEYREMIAFRLHLRLPEFAQQARFVRGLASLYDVTPDWHPVLGRVPEVEGFVLCVGHSGHGFKLAPAFGEVIAEEVLDGRATTIDIDPLRLGRFAEGRLLHGVYPGNQA